MRIAPIAAAILAFGLAAPAFAQPVAPLPAQAQPPGSPKADAASEKAASDQALAMTIRAQKEQDERIARIACAAGDKDKCAQLDQAKPPAAPDKPSP